MGCSPRIAALAAAALVAIAAAAPAGGVAASRRAYRCPAPVPVVGDVRRAQVDLLFFATMRRAEAAARMPLQADVDAALTDSGLIAEAQSPGYTKTNVLLYSFAPGGSGGFRVGFYTTETWGYAILQRTLDAAPAVTDNEATYRQTGGDLAAVDAALSVARGWRIAGPHGRYPSAAVLVRDALARGVNQGRVTTLATPTTLPRTGWVGIYSAAGDQLAVTGRTCSKAVSEVDEGGVTRLGIERRAARRAICPAAVSVPATDRRAARRLFDAAMERSLLAGHSSPEATDLTDALAATGLTATDVTTTPRGSLPADGIVYELAPDRFAVTRRVAGGAVYRIRWIGLDLPIVVRAEVEPQVDAVAGFAWQVDRLAGRIHRRHGRFSTASAIVARFGRTSAVPLRRLRSARSLAPAGYAGVWVSSDRRTALVAGRVCHPVQRTYAKT